MTLQIDEHILLEQVAEKHSQPVFDLVAANRACLRQWLPWVDHMQTVDFINNFVEGSNQRNKEGIEHAFVIVYANGIAGRIGVYNINRQNSIGEIGYWVAQDMEGRGIVTRSCKGLIDYCFSHLHLNRIEIKCAVENTKSQQIPERLLFTHEGIIRQGEWVHGRFINLKLYSMLKEEWV